MTSLRFDPLIYVQRIGVHNVSDNPLLLVITNVLFYIVPICSPNTFVFRSLALE